jgi:hypothetical protein
MIEFKCPHCNRDMCFKDELAGEKINCIHCHEPTTVPTPMTYGMQPADPQGGPPPGGTDFSNLREPDPSRYYERDFSRPSGGGGSNPIVGWLIFILIFGVGNIILYSTTGIVIIPIRR